MQTLLSRRTPVLDHADQVLYEADRETAAELLTRPGIDVIRKGDRIKAFRYSGPDTSLSMLAGSRHRRAIGAPHTKENYYNVEGAWHIDRIPSKLRGAFHAVVGSTTK